MRKRNRRFSFRIGVIGLKKDKEAQPDSNFNT